MEGHGAVFSALLHSIWREGHCLDDADDEGLSDHLLGQFAALCRQKNRVAERQTDSCNDHLFERARRFINANIADPALTPTAVAKALGISTSHLHAIARGKGPTVRRLILMTRLELCRRGARWPYNRAIARPLRASPHESGVIRSSSRRSRLDAARHGRPSTKHASIVLT